MAASFIDWPRLKELAAANQTDQTTHLRLFIGNVVTPSFSHAPAAAQDKMVVDVSKMTCGELTKLGFQDFAGITMWLSGYYNASIRNTVIDLYQFAQAARTVKDFCQTSPRATVMSEAARALGIKMPRPR